MTLGMAGFFSLQAQMPGKAERIQTLVTNWRACSNRVECTPLGELFSLGDARIDDVIDVMKYQGRFDAMQAEELILYLGNDKGRDAIDVMPSVRLMDPGRGPVPIPLRRREYTYIDDVLIGKPPADWDGFASVKFIYALALDGSPPAIERLRTIISQVGAARIAPGVTKSAISAVQTQGFAPVIKTGQEPPRTLQVRWLPFLSEGAAKHTRIVLVAQNGMKDKALYTVFVNPGPFGKEVYRVVLHRVPEGWKLYSVNLVSGVD
jgi:hypothetical protein